MSADLPQFQGRARAGWATVWASVAVLVLAGCFHEADDAREANFSVEVAHIGTNRRDPDPHTLTIGAADVKALDVKETVIANSYSTFVIFTRTVVRGDAGFVYCLKNPIVIADAASGEKDTVIPRGTCLTEKSPLQLP